jgi:hypothetical protein
MLMKSFGAKTDDEFELAIHFSHSQVKTHNFHYGIDSCGYSRNSLSNLGAIRAPQNPFSHLFTISKSVSLFGATGADTITLSI